MTGCAGFRSTATALAAITLTIVKAGGSVLVPEADPLLAHPVFLTATVGHTPLRATLVYGQPIALAGLHIVASETSHWVENLTGLGGCGVHAVLSVVSEHAQQGHPLVPVIQMAEPNQRGTLPADDIDLFLSREAVADEAAIVRLVVEVAQRAHEPVALAQGFVDFQLTRGLLGITT